MSSDLTAHTLTTSPDVLETQYAEHNRLVEVQLCAETRYDLNQSPDELVWALSWRVGTGVGLRIVRREPRSCLEKLRKYLQKGSVTSTQDADAVLHGTNIAIIDMECYTLGALTSAQRMELLRLANATPPESRDQRKLSDREWLNGILADAMIQGIFKFEQVERCIEEALA